MLDLVARDTAARIVKWGELTTPYAFAIDAPGLPAPHGVVALSRVPLARATVLAGGSRFRPGVAGPALLALDDDLPYAPAGGAPLQQAGNEENLKHHKPGHAFVLVDPAGASPDDAEVVALATARAFVDNPYALAKAITTARSNVGPDRLLYLPGCGLPQEVALLAYAGVDLFDDAAAVLAARQGSHLTPEGALPSHDPSFELVAHARSEVQREVERVRLAIRAGKLRELVEQRSRATPTLAAHLRRLDKEAHEFFSTRAPLLRHGPMYTTSKESLDRPEVERFRRRLHARYSKPASARVLVLLPCSATKPYSDSKTHRILESALMRVRNRLAVHEVVLTSPLGIVPRELERCYPAAHYDLPVTGHWDEDEKLMIREALTALVARSRYDSIVVHLDEVEMEIAAPVLGDFHYTVEKDPLSRESLDNLHATLNKLADPLHRVGWRQRALDDFASLARFQFGEPGHALVEGAEVKGKEPFLRLVDAGSGAQIAMVTPDRGYLSLAPDGGKRLMESGKFRVEIDDFRPKGTVFAVGVKAADPDIAPEDEVLLVHNGDFRGVGRALAPGADMGRMSRGACVSVRHKEAVK
jgi:archaeosine synthase alpha-subunit